MEHNPQYLYWRYFFSFCLLKYFVVLRVFCIGPCLCNLKKFKTYFLRPAPKGVHTVFESISLKGSLFVNITSNRYFDVLSFETDVAGLSTSSILQFWFCSSNSFLMLAPLYYYYKLKCTSYVLLLKFSNPSILPG